MEDLDVSVQDPILLKAVKSLVASIIETKEKYSSEQLSLFELIHQLDDRDFLLLKKNIHFNRILQSISIHLHSVSDSDNGIVDIDEINSDYKESSNKNFSIRHNSDEQMVLGFEQDEPIDCESYGLKINIKDRENCKSLMALNTNATVDNDMQEVSNCPQNKIKKTYRNDSSTLSKYKADYLYELLGTPISSNEQLKKLAILADSIVLAKKIDLGNMRLSFGNMSDEIIKSLKKYEKHIDESDLKNRIENIIKLDEKQLKKIPRFGTSTINRLMELRRIVEREVKYIIEGTVDYINFESAFIVPKKIHKLSLVKLEQILIEDIDSYLDKISDDEIDIIQKRWGFIDIKETLEDIGSSLSITRERVRQKECAINTDFISHLRVSQSILWEVIKKELSHEFPNKISDLYLCFETKADAIAENSLGFKKNFYDFISLICNQENLFDYVYPEIDRTILNTFFVENGAPIHIEVIKEFLEDSNLDKVRSIENAVRHLAHQEVIVIEDDKVWPKQLGKAEASACVLVNHSKGLPWLDVARLVNSNCYSRTPVYEERVDFEAFKMPDYIFLAGKGVYKHTKFIDFEAIGLDDIFLDIMEYAELHGCDVFHLNQCYSSSKLLQQYDYYEIRYFIKYIGEDYGFYFDGKSQADSIGLSRGFKNITQEDVIIETMNSKGKPFTKPQVAGLLKSKSLNHAAYYLDRLMKSGEVVQIDRMLYTTPEVAYKDIDLDKILNAIEKTLNRYNIPVEPSIMKIELNKSLSKTYSKFFYSSIARLYAQEKGWFRKYNLYSLYDIPYDSFTDALEKICNLDLSTKQNIELVQKAIAVDNQTVDSALRNWQDYSVNNN